MPISECLRSIFDSQRPASAWTRDNPKIEDTCLLPNGSSRTNWVEKETSLNSLILFEPNITTSIKLYYKHINIFLLAYILGRLNKYDKLFSQIPPLIANWACFNVLICSTSGSGLGGIIIHLRFGSTLKRANVGEIRSSLRISYH